MLSSILGKNAGWLHTGLFAVFTVVNVYFLFTLDITTLILWLTLSNPIIGFLISGYQHRYCSHRSWQPPRWLEVICAYSSAALLMTPSMAWAATHREHHRYTDKEGDPHGHVHSVLDNFLVFNRMPSIRMVPKWMIRDKLYVTQARWYWEIFIITMIIAYALNLHMFLISAIAMSYFFQVTLNLLGHTRNFKLVNSHVLSVLYSGELYHKYHHEKPMDPRFGVIDAPYYLFIKWFNNETKRS